MCSKLGCGKGVLKVTTANLLCLQALFCLYSFIRIIASRTRLQLVDRNGYLDSHFLNNSRNDCVIVLSFVGVLIALFGFYKKRYQYLLIYFTMNIACIVLIVIGNVLDIFLDDGFANMNDVFCISIITVSYSVISGIALKFYFTINVTGRGQTGNINLNFSLDESNSLELDELEKLSPQFIGDYSTPSRKNRNSHYPDYSCLLPIYCTNYDIMADRNQYLKKVLKRGP